MPTILDTLLIQIDIDPKAFKHGADEIERDLKRVKERSVEHGREMEKAIGERLSKAIDRVKLEALALFAALMGAQGLKEFVAGMTEANVRLGIFSSSVGLTPEIVSTWQNAMGLLGGSADNARSALSRVNDIAQQAAAGHGVPEWFQRIGRPLGDNPQATLMKTKDAVDAFVRDQEHLSGPQAIARRGWIWRQIGFDPDTAAIMARTSVAEIQSTLKDAAGRSTSGSQVEVAEKLEEAWVTLSQTVKGFGENVLERVSGTLGAILNQLTEWLAGEKGIAAQAWFGEKVKAFATWLGEDAPGVLKAAEDGLVSFISKINLAAEALGGWKDATLLFFGIWATAEVVAIAAHIAQIVAVTSGGGGRGLGLGGFGGLASIALAIAGGLGAYYASQPVDDTPEGKARREKADAIAQQNLLEHFYHGGEGSIWNSRSRGMAMHGRGLPEGYKSDDERLGAAGGIDTSLLLKAGVPINANNRPIGASNPLPVSLVRRAWNWLTGEPSDAAAPGGSSAPSAPGAGAGQYNRGTVQDAGQTPPAGAQDMAKALKAANPNLTSEQCVALAQAMNGVGNVHEWRRGANALDTRPPPGTAVATFMGDGYQPSTQYAGGGTGTPGIGRDHAGIIAGYTPDGGMILYNQSAGHPPHYTIYHKSGSGEYNAGNYYVINNRFGRPAGKNRTLITAPTPGPTSSLQFEPLAHLAQVGNYDSAAAGGVNHTTSSSVTVGEVHVHGTKKSEPTDHVKRIFDNYRLAFAADVGLT